MSCALQAIVLSTHVTGLWVTRALAMQGVRVIVIPLDRTDLARYTRHRAETAPVFHGDCSALHDYLKGQADRWGGSVLIPTGDLALETLSCYRDSLGNDYQLSVPPESVTRQFIEKDRADALARSLQIRTPDDYGPLSRAVQSMEKIEFPVVVKPNDSRRFRERFGVKLLVAQTVDELLVHAQRVPQDAFPARVLQLIPGPDSLSYNYTAFVTQDGEFVAEFGIHKLRKSPPRFGIGRVVETMDDDERLGQFRDIVKSLVAQTGFFGPLSAEFKVDPRSGNGVFIELNGRCSFVQQLALQSGINYPWLLYQQAAGKVLEAPELRTWRGSMIHLHADILNAVFRREADAVPIREMLAPYRGRKCFAVFRWSDPLPFLVEWGRTLAEVPAVLASRDRRRSVRENAHLCRVTQRMTPERASERTMP